MEIINSEMRIGYMELACLMWATHSILMQCYKFLAKHLTNGELKLPKVLLCNHCFTFWVIIILTFDPVTAAVCSAGVYLFTGVTNYLCSNSKVQL